MCIIWKLIVLLTIWNSYHEECNPFIWSISCLFGAFHVYLEHFKMKFAVTIL